MHYSSFTVLTMRRKIYLGPERFRPLSVHDGACHSILWRDTLRMLDDMRHRHPTHSQPVFAILWQSTTESDTAIAPWVYQSRMVSSVGTLSRDILDLCLADLRACSSPKKWVSLTKLSTMENRFGGFSYHTIGWLGKTKRPKCVGR